MIEHNHYVFISQQLHTIVRVYHPDFSQYEIINNSLLAGKSPVLPDSIRDPLLEAACQDGLCTVFVHPKHTYTVFHTPENRYLIIGPNRVYHHMKYIHELPGTVSDPIPWESVYECSIAYYLAVILPSYNLYYKEMLSEADYYTANFFSQEEFKIQENFSDLVFQHREENTLHNPYSQELRMLSSIEQGDLELLEECRRSEIRENYGTLSKDYTRNYKNLGICVIALVSRAAIRGGVNSELAFSLCDSYIMGIEQLKDITDLSQLVETAKTDFCTMVKEQREQKQTGCQKKFHPLVEKSKDYIFSHLHGKLTLKETADFLKVNPNYLSDLFRQYEGIPFSSFVTAEKLRLVKNLLIYSPYSYSQIATYLGFTSQSYLGKQFKEYTGMTLKEYRDHYSVDAFIQ